MSQETSAAPFSRHQRPGSVHVFAVRMVHSSSCAVYKVKNTNATKDDWQYFRRWQHLQWNTYFVQSERI